jgi:hypothetical protein
MEAEKKQPSTFELFHIGSDFHTMSDSKMSSLYEAKTFKRWDYGQVISELSKFNNVNIRPATHQEMNWAWKELGKLTHENFKK